MWEQALSQSTSLHCHLEQHQILECAEAICARYEGGNGAVSTSTPAAVPSAAAANAAKVTIAYSTGWKQAYLHYQKADGSTSLC